MMKLVEVVTSQRASLVLLAFVTLTQVGPYSRPIQTRFLQFLDRSRLDSFYVAFSQQLYRQGRAALWRLSVQLDLHWY